MTLNCRIIEDGFTRGCTSRIAAFVGRRQTVTDGINWSWYRLASKNSNKLFFYECNSDVLCDWCCRMMGAGTGGFAVDGHQYHTSCLLHEYLIGLDQLHHGQVCCFVLPTTARLRLTYLIRSVDRKHDPVASQLLPMLLQQCIDGCNFQSNLHYERAIPP